MKQIILSALAAAILSIALPAAAQNVAIVNGKPVPTARVDALAAQLQDEGARSFVKSWSELMAVLVSKSADLRKAS